MPPDLVFDAPLAAGFKPTKPILLAGDKLTLDFIIVVAAPGGAQVDFYLEFVSSNPFDPAAGWSREVAEEDSVGGVVKMPMVVRTIYQNGNVLLAAGTHRVSLQFERSHNFARAQVRLAAGAGTKLKILSVFGTVPTPPPLQVSPA